MKQIIVYMYVIYYTQWNILAGRQDIARTGIPSDKYKSHHANRNYTAHQPQTTLSNRQHGTRVADLSPRCAQATLFGPP